MRAYDTPILVSKKGGGIPNGMNLVQDQGTRMERKWQQRDLKCRDFMLVVKHSFDHGECYLMSGER
jgi:hypothetical protein